MHRALWEFRVRGVVTNLRFLDQLIMHPQFATRGVHDQVHRRDAGAVPLPAQARPCDAAAELHRRRDRQRQSGSEGPAAPDAADEPEAAEARAAAAGAGHEAEARRAGRRAVRALDARAEARAADRHDDARRASVAARHALSHARHGGDRAVLREPAAEPVLGRMLGRRDVRRRDALPQRMSVGAPARVARGDAEPAAADAAALGERGRLHELSRQRRALLRRAGGAARASICSASSTRSTGSRTCASRSTPCASRASCARRRSATPAISPIRARRSTTSSTTWRSRAS